MLLRCEDGASVLPPIDGVSILAEIRGMRRTPGWKLWTRSSGKSHMVLPVWIGARDVLRFRLGFEPHSSLSLETCDISSTTSTYLHVGVCDVLIIYRSSFFLPSGDVPTYLDGLIERPIGPRWPIRPRAGLQPP